MNFYFIPEKDIVEYREGEIMQFKRRFSQSKSYNDFYNPITSNWKLFVEKMDSKLLLTTISEILQNLISKDNIGKFSRNKLSKAFSHIKKNCSKFNFAQTEHFQQFNEYIMKIVYSESLIVCFTRLSFFISPLWWHYYSIKFISHLLMYFLFSSFAKTTL